MENINNNFIEIKSIKPMWNRLLVSATVFSEEDAKVTGTNLIDHSKLTQGLKSWQQVIAVGDTVRNINKGDYVFIDYTKYRQMKHKEGGLKDGIIKDNLVESFNIPSIELDGIPYLLIYDSDVVYKADVFKPIVKKEIIKLPPKKIITTKDI